MSIESVMPSNHLILCRSLLLLPSMFPSIRVFSNELALHIRWPKYWSFSFTISPSNEYSGLISFRIDWFDLLVIQGVLKSPLKPQFKRINSSALSFLYGPSPSIHDYWKNHSFDNTDLVGKVMSLLFNMLSVFHSFSSKEQASFNLMAVVTICSDFGAQENSLSLFLFFPIHLPWSDGTGCLDLKLKKQICYIVLFFQFT